jgi:hypothetical protein
MVELSELDQKLDDVFLNGDEYLRFFDFIFSLACDFTDEERQKYTQLFHHMMVKNSNKYNPFKKLYFEIVKVEFP